MDSRKPESAIINQMMAHRFLSELHGARDVLLPAASAAEAQLAAEARAAGPAKPRKTLWQAAGVHRGETELEMNARVRSSSLDAVGRGTVLLQAWAPAPALAFLEQVRASASACALCMCIVSRVWRMRAPPAPRAQYTPLLSMACAGAFGYAYGGARGYFRGWWQDVTPSVCRELAGHVARRTAVGAILLVGAFEAAPQVKAKLLELSGRTPVSSYADADALSQLVAIDLSYLGIIAALNFAFPFSLVPWALNPMQLIVLPPEQTPSAPPPKK